jgi:hypothetical protein
VLEGAVCEAEGIEEGNCVAVCVERSEGRGGQGEEWGVARDMWEVVRTKVHIYTCVKKIEKCGGETGTYRSAKFAAGQFCNQF